MILIPIRTGRGQNDRMHWRAKNRMVKAEKTAVAWMLRAAARPATPCSVLLTRVAPSNGLDDDNLSGSLKATRDAVAAWVGVDDGDQARLRFRYAQRRGKWGVEITVEAM